MAAQIYAMNISWAGKVRKKLQVGTILPYFSEKQGYAHFYYAQNQRKMGIKTLFLGRGKENTPEPVRTLNFMGTDIRPNFPPIKF